MNRATIRLAGLFGMLLFVLPFLGCGEWVPQTEWDDDLVWADNGVSIACYQDSYLKKVAPFASATKDHVMKIYTAASPSSSKIPLGPDLEGKERGFFFMEDAGYLLLVLQGDGGYKARKIGLDGTVTVVSEVDYEAHVFSQTLNVTVASYTQPLHMIPSRDGAVLGEFHLKKVEDTVSITVRFLDAASLVEIGTPIDLPIPAGAFEIDDETGAPEIIYLEIDPLLAWNDAGEFLVGFEVPGSTTLTSGYSITPGNAPVVINPTAGDFEEATSSSITNGNGQALSIDPETGVISVD